MSLPEDANFENFVQNAHGMLGNDLDRKWLLEMWSGADGDLNRALNHVLDTPEDKVVRSKGGGASASSSYQAPSSHMYDEPKPKKKKKKHKAPKPAKPVHTSRKQSRGYSDDEDDGYSDMGTSAPAVQQQPPAQYGAPQSMGQPPQMAQTSPNLYPQQMYAPQQIQQFPPQNYPPPNMMQSAPQMPQMLMTNSHLAPGANPINMMALNSVQNLAMMSEQHKQYQINHQSATFINLSNRLQYIVGNPSLYESADCMNELKDLLLASLRVVTENLRNLRENSERTMVHLLGNMQSQITSLLCNPSVNTSPELLTQLSLQQNQLRILNEAVSQQQNTSVSASSSSVSNAENWWTSSTPDDKYTHKPAGNNPFTGGKAFNTSPLL